MPRPDDSNTHHRADARPHRGAPLGLKVTWFLGAWTNQVVRFAWPIVLAALVLTALAGWHTANNVRVNTDTTDMLSHELDFMEDMARYTSEFPELDQLIVIVIDGQTQDMAEDAARLLYSRLEANEDRFDSIFYPSGMAFFQRNGLLFRSAENLRTTADRLAQAQPLIGSLMRDPSTRGLFGALSETIDNLGPGQSQADVRSLGRVMERIAAVIAATADGQGRRLSWTALISGAEPTTDETRRLIIVRPKLDFSKLAPAATALNLIREEAASLGLSERYGVSVRLTGTAALNAEELQSVADGAGMAGLVSFVLVMVLLIVGLRSFWLVTSVLVTLVIGLVLTAAFATLTIGEFNMISVAFAVLFIGLGVDFGIHYALRYREDLAKGMATRGALREAARSVGGGLAIATAAATIAFLSFTPTDYRGVSELGIIAAAGMVIAFLTSMTVLPALLAIWPRRGRMPDPSGAPVASEDRYSVRGEHFLQRHGWAVILVALVLLIASSFYVLRIDFDRNPLNLKDPSSESVRTAIELIEEEEGAIETIKVLAGDPEEARETADRLEALAQVSRATTIFDYVPNDQEEKLEIIDEMALLMLPVLTNVERLPSPDDAERLAAMRNLRASIQRALQENRLPALNQELNALRRAIDAFLVTEMGGQAMASQLEINLLSGFSGRIGALAEALQAQQVDLEDLPEELREREISDDGTYRITVYPRENTRDTAALRRFVQAVQSVAPHATGGPVVQLRSGDAVVQAFAEATLIAAVAITLLLIVLLRRLVDVLLVLSPLMLAGCLTIAIAVLLGMSFNFANIIVLPLLLGLGVASGIHLVMRARREHSQEFLATSTPRAVLFSALTTVASFGSLAISPHQGTASMGELLFIAIFMTLVCALVVLPAMMAVLVGPDRA